MMTSGLFIVVVAAILIMLTYWILTYQAKTEHNKIPPHRFQFESASEVAVSTQEEFYLGPDTIKLKINDGCARGYWNLSHPTWQAVCAQNGIKPDLRSIVLRLTEAGEHVHYADMWVNTTAGQYQFKIQPLHSYYLTLGIYHFRSFIPVLTSNTIMLHK